MSSLSKIVLVIPLLNDWESADLLCKYLDLALQKANRRANILFVDDGSTVEFSLPAVKNCSSFDAVKILHLKRNLGHQRAIAVGLAYVQENVACEIVVVMDGDGEDKPEDTIQLINALEKSNTEFVFAERGRRPETFTFRVGYLLYRILHRLLTGRAIRFGNFSAMRFVVVRRLTVMSEMWSHYAASVVLARIPYSTIRVDRGKRFRGTSKMSFDALVLHGMAAMALYPAMNVRVMIGSGAVSLLLGFCIIVTIAIKFSIDLAIPAWTTMVIAVGIGLVGVATFMSLLFAFLTASFRILPGLLPIRDYQYYVDSCTEIDGNTIHR